METEPEQKTSKMHYNLLHYFIEDRQLIPHRWMIKLHRHSIVPFVKRAVVGMLHAGVCAHTLQFIIMLIMSQLGTQYNASDNAHIVASKAACARKSFTTQLSGEVIMDELSQIEETEVW